MLRIIKNNRGEKITRMIDAQWILRIFETTHLNARANTVQVTPSIDPWGCATMEWVKNRMIEEYQDMKANGKMIACTMPLVRPCEIQIIGDEIFVSFVLVKQKVKWRSWRRSPTSSSPEILT
jgi:hypothetical protein